MGHLVVAGAGAIGLFAARSAHRRGWEVTVLDAAEPGGGASTNNAGWIVPSLSTPLGAPGVVRQSLGWMLGSDGPLYIRPRLDPSLARWLVSFWRRCTAECYRDGMAALGELSRPTRALLDGARAEGIGFEVHRNDLLVLCRSREELDRQLAAFEGIRAFGYEPEPLEDVAEVEPGVMDDVAGAVRIADERNVRPDSLMAGLARHLREQGVEVRAREPVVAIDAGPEGSDGPVAVWTREGKVLGDALLIAAGVWTPGLARLVDRRTRLPIQAGKGYTLDYEPAPVAVSHLLYLQEGRVAVSPLDGGVRLAGTVEFSGRNARLVRGRVRAIARAAARYLRGWPEEVEGIPCSAGLRPMTPDSLPVIGPLGGRANVLVAAGHGKQGLTLAPATGEAVAECLATGSVPDVLRPFDPGRFTRR